MSQPFDATSGRASGDAVPIADQVDLRTRKRPRPVHRFPDRCASVRFFQWRFWRIPIDVVWPQWKGGGYHWRRIYSGPIAGRQDRGVESGATSNGSWRRLDIPAGRFEEADEHFDGGALPSAIWAK